jgi:hypothetical protein
VPNPNSSDDDVGAQDVSFWVNEQFTENNLCEMVRGVGGDLVRSPTHSKPTRGDVWVRAVI